ncbi:hypothetical protein EC991_006102 [Linnemannia zychae]|nr:hypothetical protein EC991_006102 [Linnemannia zychae]
MVVVIPALTGATGGALCSLMEKLIKVSREFEATNDRTTGGGIPTTKLSDMAAEVADIEQSIRERDGRKRKRVVEDKEESERREEEMDRRCTMTLGQHKRARRALEHKSLAQQPDATVVTEENPDTTFEGIVADGGNEDGDSPMEDRSGAHSRIQTTTCTSSVVGASHSIGFLRPIINVQARIPSPINSPTVPNSGNDTTDETENKNSNISAHFREPYRPVPVVRTSTSTPRPGSTSSTRAGKHTKGKEKVDSIDIGNQVLQLEQSIRLMQDQQQGMRTTFTSTIASLVERLIKGPHGYFQAVHGDYKAR